MTDTDATLEEIMRLERGVHNMRFKTFFVAGCDVRFGFEECPEAVLISRCAYAAQAEHLAFDLNASRDAVSRSVAPRSEALIEELRCYCSPAC